MEADLNRSEERGARGLMERDLTCSHLLKKTQESPKRLVLLEPWPNKPKNKAKASSGVSGVFSVVFCFVKVETIKTQKNVSWCETHTRQLFNMKMIANH